VITIAAAVSLATNFGSFGFSSTADQGRLALVNVPRDAATLQQADALVRPGGTILISPGTYRESALIDKARVVVRGLDRNRVVFDGGWRMDDGITVTAPGVSVENLTVRRRPRRRPRQ
jgi:nitrous oxidase accessory protein NosD